MNATTPPAPSKRAPLRVAIVEDEDATRKELAELLEQNPRFSVVARFANARTALDGLPDLGADLVLMDLHLAHLSGAECTRRLKTLLPDLKVVILTKFDDANHIFEALKAGADGYLLKNFGGTELEDAILSAANGGAPMSGEVAVRVLRYFREPPRTQRHLNSLSQREREVLDLLAQGFSYKEIAHALAICHETVNDHIKRIYKKLHVHSAVEAVQVLRGGVIKSG